MQRGPLSSNLRIFFGARFASNCRGKMLFALHLLALHLLTSPARSMQPTHISLAATAECPSVDDVARQLNRILPALSVSPADSPQLADVVLAEDATGMTVAFRDTQRHFEDSERRCQERASQAAVFIALVLDPLRLPPAPPSRPAAPLPRAATARQTGLELELGPSLWFAPGSGLETVPLAGGGGLRLNWGSAVALTGGAGVLSTTTLRYPEASARELLLPLDLGARLATQTWPVNFGAELSFTFAPARLSGQNVDRAKSGWRVELGVRAALFATWWLSDRIGVFLSESALVWPHPVRLTLGGVGDVGATPSTWVGSQLGLALKIK